MTCLADYGKGKSDVVLVRLYGSSCLLDCWENYGYFGLVRLCTEFVKIGLFFILSIDPVAICVDILARICFLWPEFVFCGHILDKLAR